MLGLPEFVGLTKELSRKELREWGEVNVKFTLNGCDAFAQTEEIASFFSRILLQALPQVTGVCALHHSLGGYLVVLIFKTSLMYKKSRGGNVCLLKNLSHPHDGAKMRMIRSTSSSRQVRMVK